MEDKNIVKYNCTLPEMIDTIRKYKNDLLLILDTDKLQSLKSISKLLINNYSSEKCNIDKIIEQILEIQYLYTIKNKPYCILEVFEEYIQCIMLQGIINESNADEIIYILKQTCILDVETRKESTSFEDYWVKWVSRSTSVPGKKIFDLMVKMIINIFTNKNVINNLNAISNTITAEEQKYIYWNNSNVSLIEYWIDSNDRLIEALNTKF